MKKFFAFLTVVTTLMLLISCEDTIKKLRGKFSDVQNEYDRISSSTGGQRYDADNSRQVPGKIRKIVQTYCRVSSDLVFLIDKTDSMDDDIHEIKESLSDIISSLPSGTNLALGTFGDKNADGAGWFSLTPFTTDYESIRTELSAIKTTGGGDQRESIYDALYKTISDLNWTSQSKKMIIMISDAPPLKGSKSEHTLDEVTEIAKEKNVNIYSIAIKM